MNEEILDVMKQILDVMIYTKQLDKYDLLVMEISKKPLLDTADVMLLFQNSERTIARWRADGIIDYTDVNGSCYYKFTELLPLLNSREKTLRAKINRKK
ncbi:hypothetical protein [Pedobacter sp. MR2016-24]|uniref:hypothetical protein n=1 Tax=Pedobacter sp. MR2016-24 TaxID=2994466 RepID=UPI00224635E3|nr:hypothetical protein [Pedobacter sp. MR2016-24]MCX2483746.1 hypothetical protein [Pedobacter sp. MR2016-24]